MKLEKRLLWPTSSRRDDPNNSYVQRYIGSDSEELCKCLAYAGLFSEVRSQCRRAIAIDENMMKSDKDNVQASCGLRLYQSDHEAWLCTLCTRRERPSRSCSGRTRFTRTWRFATPTPNQMQSTTPCPLIYLGRIDARLHEPELARRDLEQAQEILEQLVKRQSEAPLFPKHAGGSPGSDQGSPV